MSKVLRSNANPAPEPPRLDQLGYEIPDPTPLQIPVGFKRPETLAEQVQRLVRTSISQEAAAQGDETFEESEDFDIGDEPPDPSTPYEEWFDPVLGRGITEREFRDNWEVYRQRYLEAEKRAWEQFDHSAALRRPYRDETPPDEPRSPPAEHSGRSGAKPPKETPASQDPKSGS